MATYEQDKASDAARAAREEISRVAGKASEKLDAAVDSAKSIASENIDKVEAAIRRNPLAAAGIAAGIGFFLAVIARR
ncbi:MAG: hypothetical protein AB7K67_17475 [Hyphomicrobiaceae bacterium]